MLARTRAIARYQRAIGFYPGLRWWLIRSANGKGWIRQKGTVIKPNYLAYGLRARLGKSSDPDVFDQIMVTKELSRLCSMNPPQLIVDLGANVGYSSAFLLNAFPKAHILAVEPDPSNAALCRLNLSAYGHRAQILEGAAWYRNCRLALSPGTFGDGREWATQRTRTVLRRH